MEKIKEIKNVLEFYTRANKMKDVIIDEENGFSVADGVFGAMILATAIDSEYKEAKDLGKIIRMLFLVDFVWINNNYNLKQLKLGDQFLQELNESRYEIKKDFKLVLKYKILDQVLTKFISQKENVFTQSQLIEVGAKIIESLCKGNSSSNKEIFKFYYLNYKLKNKVRTGWDKNHWNIKTDRKETVSEHIVGTIALAMGICSEFGYDVDFDEVLKVLVIHETGETLIDDYTPFDGITPERKRELEHKAMFVALGRLKEKDKMLNKLYVFDDKETEEAIVEFYCDKFEADLQSKVYLEKGLHRSLDDQKNNIVFKSSKVKKMEEDGAETAFDIWYYWDRDLYNNPQYPEFSNMLDYIKDNDIIDLYKKDKKNEESYQFKKQ